MRSWGILLVSSVDLIILVGLIKCSGRLKRDGNYGFNGAFHGYEGGVEDVGPPHTGFNCAVMPYPGIYADMNAGCKAFHVCAAGDGNEDVYYCPQGTMFDQQHFVCDWWYNVDCSATPHYYGLNAEMFAHGSRGFGGDSFRHKSLGAMQGLRQSTKTKATMASDQANRAVKAAKKAIRKGQAAAYQLIRNVKASTGAHVDAIQRHAQQMTTALTSPRETAAEASAAAFRARINDVAHNALKHASTLKETPNFKLAIGHKARLMNFHIAVQDPSRQRGWPPPREEYPGPWD